MVLRKQQKHAFIFLMFIFSLEFFLMTRVWWSLSHTTFHLAGKSQWYFVFIISIEFQIPLLIYFRFIYLGYTVFTANTKVPSRGSDLPPIIVVTTLQIFYDFVKSRDFKTRTLSNVKLFAYNDFIRTIG